MATLYLHSKPRGPIALGKRHFYDTRMVEFLRVERMRTAIGNLAHYKHSLNVAKLVHREMDKRHWAARAEQARLQKKRVTRNMNLALAFMRGTPYFKCEAKCHEAPDALHIASIVVACLSSSSPEKNTSIEGRKAFCSRWIRPWLSGFEEPW